jgi:hypothetical protein
VYPINDTLISKAGGNKSDAEIKSMVSHWMLADRIRFLIGLVGYFCEQFFIRLMWPCVAKNFHYATMNKKNSRWPPHHPRTRPI